jgi:hypothetical protein
VPHSAQKNITDVLKACGQKANVIVATTMWDEVKDDIGLSREQELAAEDWKDLLQNGCSIQRFEKSCESAWHIIGNLADKHPAEREGHPVCNAFLV